MEIPRRNRIDQYTPAETAIRAAKLAVEASGCHILLTDAVVLLGQAQDKVADFVDGQDATQTDYDVCPVCSKSRSEIPGPPSWGQYYCFTHRPTSRNETHRKLESLKDYEDRRLKESGIFEKPTGIACPQCNSELFDVATNILIGSKPARKLVYCKYCDYKSTTFVQSASGEI
jgi:uncharacterized protein with PIN domain